jgi:hypothetical protein
MKQFAYVVVVLVLSACSKNETLPTTPSIELKNFTNYNNDSADCIISFKDGDGDIGIVEGDTASDDDLKMKYLYKDTSGVFLPYDFTFNTPTFDTLYYSYRVPDVAGHVAKNGLEGDIKIKLRSSPLFNPKHSVVKFEIRLTDRAGHKSNIVTTNEIVIKP